MQSYHCLVACSNTLVQHSAWHLSGADANDLPLLLLLLLLLLSVCIFSHAAACLSAAVQSTLVAMP
jgi:hypothetical protein